MGTGDGAEPSEEWAGSGDDDVEVDFLKTRLYSRSKRVSFLDNVPGHKSAVLLRESLLDEV